MKKLADIEDIVEVQDYSLVVALLLVMITFVLAYLLFLSYKKRKNKKPTREELALKAYKEIEFSNPKRAAYLITKYGYVLAKNQKSKEILKELVNDLTRYKYKKEVEPFDEKTIGLYHLFLEVVSNE